MLSTLFFTGLLMVRLATTTTVINKRAALGRPSLASQRWESKHTCIYDACGTNPICNGCAFSSSGASNYTLNCGSRVQGSDQWVVESDGLAVTGSPDCLEACDEWPQCGGVSVASNGSCIAVSNRTPVSLVDDVGSRAYMLMARGPQAVATAVSASTASSAALFDMATPPSYFNTSSSISPLAPTAAPASTQPTNQCQLTNISCPDCDGEQVIDATGKHYKVFCDSQIFSEDQYNIQEWLSPQGCLAECDRFSWCQGTTYYANRNCELANGTDAFPEQMPGYTGFLPVATKSYVPATAPSAFPTTNSYIPVSNSASTLSAVVPSTTISIASQPTTSCDSSKARCPLCDGVSVVDWLNVTYKVSCQEVPICETIIHRENGTSQFECLEYCDADPVCFAAVWNGGDCQLCQDGLDGTIFNDQPDDPKFLVYYPQSAGTANMTVSLPQITTTSVQASTTSDSGSISILPFHGGTFITAPPPNATITSSSTDSTAMTTIPDDTTSIIVVTSASLSILPINGDTLITAPTPSSTSSVVVITGTITGADYTGS
ncbi:hypothetical protein LTR86_002830 [Recurvomyces mirabilis]|nr:hypothetical protein LTR86_002830 [Recurvomyces mirabilis]